ncbi:GNAT family N-acetyltransferase [Streptomyces sp. NPDC047315]|uniref:GNAT family N-acetyltransferase n=1 Tax=Streptomyces sp. NPDC047315 TaxID=3155142 RepID=UPI0033D9DF7A
MTELCPSAAWPPAPITTERLVLRESEARDRAAFVGLFSSPEVNAYLGGPQPREALERDMPAVPGRRPGLFVVDLDGAMIGQVLLTRDSGHLPQAEGRVELGYLFLPSAWGRGYATEACEAALAWFATTLPGEPVVLATQTANAASMRLASRLGFEEEQRFVAYEAEQSFALRPPPRAPGRGKDDKGFRAGSRRAKGT